MKRALANTTAGLVMLIEHTANAMAVGVVDGSGDNYTAVCKELLDVVQSGFCRE